MSAILEPRVNFDIVPIQQLASVQEQKVLIVGQMLGNAVIPKELVIDIPNDYSEDNLFGAKSHITNLIREFKAINKISRLDALPLADSPTGADSYACSFYLNPVAPSATSDGSITLIIGSEKKYSYTVDIKEGDNYLLVQNEFLSLILADLKSPFTASLDASGHIIIEVVNKGGIGGGFAIKVTPGLYGGLLPLITPWENANRNNPDLTDLFDVVGDIRYQTIVWPAPYPYTILRNFLNARFNADNEILDGVALKCGSESLAGWKDAAAAENDASIIFIANKEVDRPLLKGTGIVEMPDNISAQVAAIRALRLTEGAPLSDYLTTVASRDQYGGIAISSLPYFNTIMPNIAVPISEDMWTKEEQDELKDAGVSVIGPDRDYSKVVMGEFVTTYTKNEFGDPDPSFKYLNTIDTISNIREFLYVNCRQRFAQTRLTDGDLDPGRDMANEGSIRVFFNELYVFLADDMLVKSGQAGLKDFNQNLIISVDVSTGTVTVNCAPLLVSQLRAIVGTIRINFGG